MPALFCEEVSGPNYAVLKFRFQINGTDDPDFIVGSEGIVSDIARDSAGVFFVTLAPAMRFQTLVTGFAKVQNDPTFDAQLTDYVYSTGVVTITTILQDGSSAADDPTDDTWVHVELTLCKTSNGAPTKAI